MNADTWLVTGASSGFGRLICERAAAEGATVLAVGRRGDRLAELSAACPRLTPLVLDLTAPAAQEILASAIAAAGGLDVLVNNAGTGLFGAVEQTDDQSARAVLDANVLANLTVLRAALPPLRASRGRVIQMSSYVSQFAWPGSGIYSASKAAVELISDALAIELAPTGVTVTVIEPGKYATEFSTTSSVIRPDPVYRPTVSTFLREFAQLPPEAIGDPAEVAQAVMVAARAEDPPLRLAVGGDAVDGIRAALLARLAELERWEPVSRDPFAGSPAGAGTARPGS